jgi:hypothetical protein
MLKTFLDFKYPLLYVSKMTSSEEFNNHYLNSNDWFLINKLKAILEVFLKPSIKLQGEIYVTLPKGLLYIYQIYNKLNTLKDTFEIQYKRDIKLVYIY